MPDGQSVADIRPRRFSYQTKIDAFGFGKTQLFCRDENRAIEQGHEACGYLVFAGHFHDSFSGGASRPAAVINPSAISAILRFWFIAVLRKSE